MKRVFRAHLKEEKKWVYWNEFGELTTKTGKVRRLTLLDACGRTRYYSHVWEIKRLIEIETIGQYVCRDKKQEPIFEGDIVKARPFLPPYEVIYENFEIKIRNEYGNILLPQQEAIDWMRAQVIGNKWDNPELLEG